MSTSFELMTYESPRLRNRDAADHAKDTGVAILSSVTGLGGLAAALDKLGPDRHKEWIQAADLFLADLPAHLFESDEFIQAVQRAQRLIERGDEGTEPEMWAAGLRKIAIEPGEWGDEVVARMFRMLERFGATHIEVMKMLKECEAGFGLVPRDPADLARKLMNGKRSGGETRPTVATDDPLRQAAIARDLDDFNLIDSNRAEFNVVFGGRELKPSCYEASLLSAEGQHLLEFLEHYVNQPDGETEGEGQVEEIDLTENTSPAEETASSS